MTISVTTPVTANVTGQVIYGANVNCTDRWGGDPLKDAIRGGHSQVQSILREAGGRGDQVRAVTLLQA